MRRDKPKRKFVLQMTVNNKIKMMMVKSQMIMQTALIVKMKEMNMMKKTKMNMMKMRKKKMEFQNSIGTILKYYQRKMGLNRKKMQIKQSNKHRIINQPRVLSLFNMMNMDYPRMMDLITNNTLLLMKCNLQIYLFQLPLKCLRKTLFNMVIEKILTKKSQK